MDKAHNKVGIDSHSLVKASTIHIDKNEEEKTFHEIRRYHSKLFFGVLKRLHAYILILKNVCHIEGCLCVLRRHIFTDFNNDGIWPNYICQLQ